MNHAPIENEEIQPEERREWVSPQVSRMRAGEAENAGGAVFDGGAGLS